MSLLSLIAYIVSGVLIYLSFWVAEGDHFEPLMFWDLSSFIGILGGAFIVLANFKFSEVYNAIADALSKNKRVGFEERYSLNKIVINAIGNYTLFSSVLISIVAFIITLSYLTQLNKLGVSIAVILTSILYAVIVRLFFVIPLNTSLDKKMANSAK